MNSNDEIIVLVKYKNEYSWFVSQREIWFFNTKKRIDAYKKLGYEVKIEWLHPIKQELLVINDSNFNVFYERIQKYKVSVSFMQELFQNAEEENKGFYYPSLFVNADEKIFYSFYQEYESFEDFAPENWTAKYQNFYSEIPQNLIYWKGENL